MSETIKETKKVATIATDYKALYTTECEKNKALETKCAEYEKLIKSYAATTEQNNNALQRATLQYKARTEFMLDCVKHAYLSMQFSVAAGENKGGKQ